MRIITLVTALVIAAFVPAVANAHAHLDRAEPPVGSASPTAPHEVALWFTAKIEPAFSGAEVRNEKGAVVSGKSSASGTQIRVPLKALPSGTYKVIWHVLSVDTHKTQGNFIFRVGN
ncbi:MAG: copper resistance protein CopC [Pseudolabrys sp.]